MSATPSPPQWTPVELSEFIAILINHAKAAELPMTVAALEFAQFAVKDESKRQRTDAAS